MAERIDAHHHLWRYSTAEYGWIGPGMEAIARDFLPSDLAPELQRCGISGAVAVQARQSLAETEWLLEQAKQSDLMRGVVGWAPIADASFARVLERWKDEALLKGLRHVVQDEPDDNFLDGGAFNEGVARIAPTGLVYDILIYERQLPAAIRFVDRHPNQIFVLDHLAKPRIKVSGLQPWRENFRELARRDNVFCKISGLVTEADWNRWRPEDLRPYVEAALEAFGARRLMMGSDWPVCLLASSYERWYETLQGFLRRISQSEQEMIFGGTATQVYSL
ncbi:MAG TPA: amidohydrolase family protein [Dongiaceae bacterium]|nr:amidohydrolase family protein [Dongiaceae bacterium]